MKGGYNQFQSLGSFINMLSVDSLTVTLQMGYGQAGNDVEFYIIVCGQIIQ